MPDAYATLPTLSYHTRLSKPYPVYPAHPAYPVKCRTHTPLYHLSQNPPRHRASALKFPQKKGRLKRDGL